MASCRRCCFCAPEQRQAALLAWSLQLQVLTAAAAQKRFPEYEIYTGREGPMLDLLDISKIENELGMSMIPLEETVVDMAQSLIQLGLAVPKLKKGY